MPTRGGLAAKPVLLNSEPFALKVGVLQPDGPGPLLHTLPNSFYSHRTSRSIWRPFSWAPGPGLSIQWLENCTWLPYWQLKINLSKLQFLYVQCKTAKETQSWRHPHQKPGSEPYHLSFLLSASNWHNPLLPLESVPAQWSQFFRLLSKGSF